MKHLSESIIGKRGSAYVHLPQTVVFVPCNADLEIFNGLFGSVDTVRTSNNWKLWVVNPADAVMKGIGLDGKYRSTATEIYVSDLPVEQVTDILRKTRFGTDLLKYNPELKDIFKKISREEYREIVKNIK